MKRRLAIVLSHPIQHFCPLYAAWATAADWEIHVFFASRAGATPYFDGNFGRTIAWDGLPLDRFPHTFLNGEAAPAITNTLDAPALDAALDAFRPAALLTYGYNQRLQRRAQAWAIRHGTPLVFFSDGELRHRRPLWKSLLKQVVVRRLLRRIDWFIVTGNANEEYYRHYGVPASRMIRGSYPIDRAAYRAAHERRATLRAAARQRLGIGGDEFVAATVGKLVPWKRQIDLVEAVGRMPGPDVVGLVIGAGAEQEEWERRGRELGPNRTLFTGFTPAEQLPELYAAADVYVHASAKEPHSVAVSEAIFMGLPVVISDRCGSHGTDDDVRQGVNGFVYPCGDVDALAARLSWFVAHPDERAAMGRAAHAIGSRQQDVVYDELPATLAVLLDLPGGAG